MKEFGVPSNKLILEITERMMLIQSQNVLRKISMLQRSGFQFSVDDFGTGYSSLASLKNFNFDYLKIDSHFVQTLAPDSLDASLVSAMIAMAKGLNFDRLPKVWRPSSRLKCSRRWVAFMLKAIFLAGL